MAFPVVEDVAGIYRVEMYPGESEVRYFRMIIMLCTCVVGSHIISIFHTGYITLSAEQPVE